MIKYALTISNSKAYAAVAFIAAAVLALAIGRDLLHMPLQVSDSLSPILDAARSPSAWHEFSGHVNDASYFRPVRYATIKIVSDLGNGHCLSRVPALSRAARIRFSHSLRPGAADS